MALLAAAAALAPTAPAADAPVPLPDTTALVDATLQATDPAATPDAESVLQAVEEVADLAAVPVEPHTTATAAPAQTQPAPAEQPATPPAAAPVAAPEAPVPTAAAPAPAPEAPVKSAEAPSETAAAAPAQAAVEQQRPVNVNISIRVESPGDNGPVSQTNAAVGAVAAEPAAAPEAVVQPEPPAEQSEAAAPAPTPAAPESPSPTSATAPASAEAWDWTWNWDCGGVISPDLVLPSTSSLPIWSWNWNWNCGADPAVAEKTRTEMPPQYHGTTRQYQPINVNISIRMSSPGNDGAVSQANIAQTIVSVVTSAVQPVLSAGGKPAAGPSPASTAAASSETPAAAVDESLAEVIVELTAEMAAVPLELVVDLECCAVPVPLDELLGDDGSGGGVAEGATLSPAAGGVRLGRKRADEPRDITAVLASITSEATVAPRAVAALVVPKPRAEAARRAAVHERLTKHVKHRAAPATERAAVLSYGGIGPLGAPDRSPKILLLFLLPFVFALVAAARRVEDDDRAAAAEPGRPEGRPG